MQKNINKPVLVPTAYSSRTALFTAALVVLFGALLWDYCAWSDLRKADERLREPVQKSVETPLYTVRLPLGWEAYARDGSSLAVFRRKGEDIPVIFCHAEKKESFTFHALDMNPLVVFHKVEESILAARIAGMPEVLPVKVVGTELLTVRPGVSAVRMLFDVAELDGEAMLFYAGDVRYVIWALWDDADEESGEAVHRFFRRIFDGFSIPEPLELIDRPVVHSGRFTAEQNSETLKQVAREIALWRMFAARAETEPETALLSAILHYREALRLLSSIRQENVELGSEDFKLFKRLREQRRREVGEWFVVLDKAVAMKDWAKARSQAQWIVSHATLNGERPDVRRAADILATKIPAEDAGAEKK